MTNVEKTKQLYKGFLDEYLSNEALSKLPQIIYVENFNKRLYFESIFQKTIVIKDNPFESSSNKLKILFGNPGEGKSFLLMRIAKALINQEITVLDDYADFVNDTSLYPSFISLNKASYVTKSTIEELLCYIETTGDFEGAFAKLVYYLTSLMLPASFNEKISESDFLKFISEERSNLLFFLDGFDEVFDSNLLNLIFDILNKIDNKNIIISSRTIEKSFLDKKITYSAYYLQEITDIELFAKGIFESVYTDDEESKGYKKVISQLKMPYYSYLESLTKNPLTLSLLLSLSFSELRLPENKSDLFEKCIQDFLERYSIKKTENNIGKADAMKLLSYIAFYMTEHDMLTIKESDLVNALKECYNLLLFRNDLKFEDVFVHLRELLKTGLLEKPFGKEYRFAIHRQIQEYFAAHAIKLNCVDAETYYRNNKLDFVCERASDNKWRQPISLYASMISGRDLNNLVIRLLKKSKEGENVSELLFLLVYDSVIKNDLAKTDIFSVVFKESISEEQLNKVIDLMQLKSSTSELLEKFIIDEAVASFMKKDKTLQYGYAAGMVSIAKTTIYDFILNPGNNPFKKIETAFIKGDEGEIYISTQSLIVLSWIYYANVDIRSNTNIKDIIGIQTHIKMSQECHSCIKQIIIDNKFDKLLLEKIAEACRESALFFFNFNENFLFDDMRNILIDRLNNEGYERYIAILLSIFSVDKIPEKCLVNEEIKNLILSALEEDIDKKIKYSAIYRFRTALVTGIISKDDVLNYWKRIQEIYHNYNEDSYGPIKNWYKETAKYMPEEKFLYLNNGDEYRFIYKASSLGEKSKEFLERVDAGKVVFSELQKIEISIFYRRNEFELIYKNSIALTSEEFEQEIQTDLSNWLYVFNKALLTSKVTSKDFGDLFLGCGVLKLALFLHPATVVSEEDISIKDALKYFSLDKKCSMLEGLILRFWLWQIDNKNDFLNERDEILTFFNKHPSYVESFADFFRVHMNNIIKEFVWRIKSLHESGLTCKPVKTDGCEKEYYCGCTLTDSRKKIFRLLFDEDGSYAFETDGCLLGERDESTVIDIFFSNFETFKEMNYIDLRETIFPE